MTSRSVDRNLIMDRTPDKINGKVEGEERVGRRGRERERESSMGRERSGEILSRQNSVLNSLALFQGQSRVYLGKSWRVKY